MTKHHSLTIRIISTITLAAFILTQAGVGYALRIEQAKGNGVGDEIKNRFDLKIHTEANADGVAVANAAAAPFIGIRYAELYDESGHLIKKYENGIPHSELPTLDKVTIRLKLDTKGGLFFGRDQSWAFFKAYPNRLIDAYVENGFVTKVRIYKENPKEGIEREEIFCQFIDITTNKIVWTWWELLTSDTMSNISRDHPHLLAITRLDNNGILTFGRHDPWGSFTEHKNRAAYAQRWVESEVEQGFVVKVRIYKENPEEGIEKELIFSKLIDKDTGKIVWTWWRQLQAPKLSALSLQYPNLVVKTYLYENGSLQFGRREPWANFGSDYAHRLIEADIEQGFVVRIRVCKENYQNGIEKEVLLSQLIDSDSGKIIWTCVGGITYKNLKKFSTEFPYLLVKTWLSPDGDLQFSRIEPWAQFGPVYHDRFIEASVEEGFITKGRIYKEGLEEIDREEIFSQLIAKDTGKIVWTWWSVLAKARFKDLVSKYPYLTVKAYLNGSGSLHLGGTAPQTFFGPEYANRLVEADMEYGFVTRIRIYKENPQEGIEKEVIFSQLIDKNTDRIVWTWREVLTTNRFKILVNKYPNLILKYRKLSSNGRLTYGGPSVHVDGKLPYYEIEAEINNGEVTLVKFVWQEGAGVIKSRVAPIFGKRSNKLFRREDDFALALAEALMQNGLEDGISLDASITLVSLHKKSLEILRENGLITQEDMQGIIDLDLSHIDIKKLAQNLKATVQGYKNLGFTDEQIKRLLNSHLLPVSFIDYLRRTYRLGENMAPIFQALRHADVEAWIKRVRETEARRGTLNIEKHLWLYDPTRAPLLTVQQRTVLLSQLEEQKALLIKLGELTQEVIPFNYQRLSLNGYSCNVRISSSGALQLPRRGERISLVINDSAYVLEVKGVDSENRMLTLIPVNGDSLPAIPKSGILQRVKMTDRALQIQIQRIQSVITSLRNSNNRTTTSPILARILGLTALIPSQPVAVEFINPKIPFRKISEFETTGDQAQEMAVKLAVNDTEVVYIEGPAGTGKTTVIVEAIREAVRRGQKVLLVSQMHQAVDNVLQEVVNDPLIPVFRLGNDPDKFDIVSRKVWPGNSNTGLQAEAFRIFKERMTSSRGFVIVATDIGIATDWFFNKYIFSRSMLGNGFDLMIMDEASRETLPGMLVPLQFLQDKGKVVFVGDQKQLPPFGLSAEEEKGLREAGISDEAINRYQQSFFEQLVEKGYGSRVMLSTNYRSNPLISGLVSELFYEGDINRRGWEDFDANTLNLQVIDISENPNEYYARRTPSGSFENERSALSVVNLVRQYAKRNISLKDITIITPYLAQVGVIKRFLREDEQLARYNQLPDVVTIDSYQGGENEVIIFDFVSSNPEGRIGFIKDLRRLNVGLSRAKDNLAIVWDSRIFNSGVPAVSEQDKEAQALFTKINNYFEGEVKTFFPGDVDAEETEVLSRSYFRFIARGPRVTANGETNANANGAIVAETVDVDKRRNAVDVSLQEAKDRKLVADVKAELGIELAALVVDSDKTRRDKIEAALENYWGIDRVIAVADESQLKPEDRAIKFIIIINNNTVEITLNDILGLGSIRINTDLEINDKVRERLESV